MLARLQRSVSARIRIGDVALALVSYVPLLLTHRGKLGADTKTYLYTNPGKLLAKAPHLWDSSVGLGTITHQNIGYLFPMGPYYAITNFLGVPNWIAQRLWMGTILFLAGIGVRYLLNTLRWEGPGVTVAAFAYALSPYLLHYIYKSSVILLPFTALPWLIAFVARSLRQGGWRYPSLFALVTLASGGINATSLLLVMIGPLLWVLHVVFIEGEMPLRKVWPPLLRIGLLTLVTSLWWMAGLYLQGSYGIDVLRYTETYKTVASASSPPEIFRSLGYWFLYGTDNLGPWFKASVTETQSIPAMVISFAVPILAIVAALLTRFRYRVFFVGLAVAGMVISVGAHPFDHPTWYGRIFNAFANTSAGLAMRSSPRALPMWDLALAVFLGAGVAALSAWQPRWRVVFAAGAIIAVVANMSPLWMGRLLDPYLERSVTAPEYWKQVGRYLDAGDRETRAMESPGIDFANYRWGASVDTILPGLTDRDESARELVPWGSDVSADLTDAVDGPFQSNTFDPAGFAALIGNMGIGDLVLRNDLEWERYNTPRPQVMAGYIRQAEAASQQSGTGSDVKIEPGKDFGPDTPNKPETAFPMVDATELSIPDGTKNPHAVVVHPVTGATPEVSAFPTASPTIVAGSGDGLVALADAGLLHGLTVYSGSVTNHPDQLDSLLADDATLVVTDTNRKAGHRWGSLQNQLGYTETAKEKPKADPSDDRPVLFPGREDDTSTQTVVDQTGGLNVSANDYGNQLTYTPSDRAANAFDGDPTTGWKVGAFSDVRGDWIQASSTTGPITTDHVGVLQAQRDVNRHITKVRITFDGKHAVDETLTPASYTGQGQVLTFPKRTFTTMRITILGTDLGVRASYKDISGVGFTEISLDGRTLHEVVRPPTDLLDAVGTKSATHPLDYLFTRQQTNPKDDTQQSPELRIVRQIDPPTARSFTVAGKSRLSPLLTDPQVDAALGATGPITYSSSSRLTGDLVSRASAAFDGSNATSWQPDINAEDGAWLQLSSASPMSIDVSGLTVVNDSRHSVPSSVHFVVDGVAGPAIPLGNVPSRPAEQGTQVTLAMPTQHLTGTTIQMVIDRYQSRTNTDWNTRRPDVMPFAISEVHATQLDGSPLRAPAPPTDLPPGCRSDLVSVGATQVPVQLVGSTADAANDDLITMQPCEAPLALPAAKAVVSATDGRGTGWDVDELTLESPAPASTTAAQRGVSASGAAVDEAALRPVVRATRPTSDSYDITMSNATKPFWLVLSQTQSPGWSLVVNGHDLGTSQLVNGYANAWLINPAALGAKHGRLTASIQFAPQRVVWIALFLSLAGAIACLVLLLRRFRGAPADLHRQAPAQPVGIGPLESFGSTPRLRSRLLATGFVLVGTTLIATWWGPILALATFAALSTKWGWTVLRFLVVGLLGVTALYVIGRELRGHFLDDFDWPQHFDTVTSLPLAAFAGLAAEAVVEALRAGWRRDAG